MYFRVKYPVEVGDDTGDRTGAEAVGVTAEGETRWLTPEQQQAWVVLLGVIARLPTALDAQLQRDAGITHIEYGVLSWLSRRPERTARMSEIAALNSVTLSHLSRIASRLEHRGWLRRASDPGDGRTTLATLTNLGWDKVVATAPGHVEAVQRHVFDHLQPTQVHQLLTLSAPILDGLSGVHPPAPSRGSPMKSPPTSLAARETRWSRSADRPTASR